MACFIKKIFEEKELEKAHPHFVRFSKGFFKGRACLDIKISNPIRISGSFEYTNDFINFILKLGIFVFEGKILSKEKLNLPFLVNEKKKASIYEYDFNGDSNNIKEISDRVYLMLLDCSNEEIRLKTKKKLPRPSKSEKKKMDDKFCQMEISSKYLSDLKNEFFWDLNESFKKAKIKHNYEIKEIVAPNLNNLKEKDFEKIRLMSKRKGVISRIIEFDGKQKEFKKNFMV